jgi:hypothetical protein
VFFSDPSYCESLETSAIWEPLSAVTSLAFILVAVALWRRASVTVAARLMVTFVLVTGAAAFTNHYFNSTLAWGVSIFTMACFVMSYTYGFGRHVLRLTWPLALAMAGGMVPFVVGVSAIFDLIPGLGLSSIYGPIALSFLGLGLLVRSLAPKLSRNLFTVMGGMLLAIPLRAIDLHLCESVPMGTHSLWHVVSAICMGWLVHGYISHVLATRATQG